MIRIAGENDIDSIYEILKKADEEGFLFITLSSADEDNIISKEEIKKDINNKNKIILIDEENRKVKGYSEWIIFKDNDQIAYYNLYTYVRPEERRNGIAKKLYSYFLDKEDPVFAEFVITKFLNGIWRTWEKKGTKLIGFVPNMYLTDSKDNLYTSILGGRVNNKESKIEILPEYEEYTKKLCKLHNLECEIEKINAEFKLSKKKGIFKISNNPYEGIRNGYIIAGILPLKNSLYMFTGDIDERALNVIESALKELGNPDYMDLFEAYKNSILNYVPR